METAHPLLNTLQQRRTAGTKPGHHMDGATIPLVIEGGGMRCANAAGMAAAIHAAGYGDAFDFVIGTSGGSHVGAYFATGQIEEQATIYPELLTKSEYMGGGKIHLSRILKDIQNGEKYPERTLNTSELTTQGSATPCYFLTTDINSGEGVLLGDFENPEEVIGALHATAAVPFAADGPVYWRKTGQALSDGGAAAGIPLPQAIEKGATAAVVLSTMHPDQVRREKDFFYKYIMPVALHFDYSGAMRRADASSLERNNQIRDDIFADTSGSLLATRPSERYVETSTTDPDAVWCALLDGFEQAKILFNEPDLDYPVSWQIPEHIRQQFAARKQLAEAEL